MTFDRYTPKALQEYRAKVAETAKLREEVQKLAEASQISGNLGPARSLFEELTLKSKELGDLREALGLKGVFLARYGYERINDHTAQFVLPKGCTRLEILQEARELVTDRPLITPTTLAEWSKLDEFSSSVASSECICIDGHVEGGDGSVTETDEFIGRKGIELPRSEDLAVAFALHWVATGEPLLGWKDSSKSCSNDIRAMGGVVLGFGDGRFVCEGLEIDRMVPEFLVKCTYGVSSYVPLKSKAFSAE
jgi:hypothetical protein